MKMSDCEQLLTIKDTKLKNVLIVTNNHSTFGPLDVIVMPGKGQMSWGKLILNENLEGNLSGSQFDKAQD